MDRVYTDTEVSFNWYLPLFFFLSFWSVFSVNGLSKWCFCRGLISQFCLLALGENNKAENMMSSGLKIILILE